MEGELLPYSQHQPDCPWPDKLNSQCCRERVMPWSVGAKKFLYGSTSQDRGDKYLIMCIKHGPALPLERVFLVPFVGCTKVLQKRKQSSESGAFAFSQSMQKYQALPGTCFPLLRFSILPFESMFQDISVQWFMHCHSNENDSFVLALFCHEWKTLPILMLKCKVSREALRVLCHLPNKSFGNILDFTKVVTTCCTPLMKVIWLTPLHTKAARLMLILWLMESASSYLCLSFCYFLDRWRNLEIFLVLVYLTTNKPEGKPQNWLNASEEAWGMLLRLLPFPHLSMLNNPKFLRS